MPNQNGPDGQHPLRSQSATKPEFEVLGSRTVIDCTFANRNGPTEVKGWKDYASQGARQWEKHRAIIKRLYIDEGKRLLDVIEIMASNYGFHASPKMYKTRLTKWGYVKNNLKNNRKGDAKLVSQTKKPAKATVDPSESQVDARNLASKTFIKRRCSTPTEPMIMIRRRLSPKPVAIQMPDAYRAPSRIFSCISAYMWGSYDSGRWTPGELANAAFYEYAFHRPSAELISSIGSLASLLDAGRYTQAGPLMRLTAIKMEEVLRTQPVDLLTCLLEVKLQLQTTAPELVTSLMRYSADITRVHFPSPMHPVRLLTQYLATVDMAEVAVEAYAAQLKVWQDIRDHSFLKAEDSVALGCVWIAGLVVAAGFQTLPSRLIPHLDDLTLRMATAMKGSQWCEELFQSLAKSDNVQLFSGDTDGKAVAIFLQPPGKPTKVVGTQPVARYKLAHLNAQCQHFSAEERSRREATEVRRVLDTDMGTFFLRMAGAIEEWLSEVQDYERAAAVAYYRESFIAAGLINIKE